MPAKWVSNARIPPETMRDLSDREWWQKLIEKYGEARVHIGPPKDAAGHTAKEWDDRGMVGIYLDVFLTPESK